MHTNRLSYEEIERLIKRVTGEKQLSNQKIRQIVVDKALEVSEEIAEETKKAKAECLKIPEVNSEVNIYDNDEKEILLFDDGIQVKGQKEKVVRPLRIKGKAYMLNRCC